MRGPGPSRANNTPIHPQFSTVTVGLELLLLQIWVHNSTAEQCGTVEQHRAPTYERTKSAGGTADQLQNGGGLETGGTVSLLVTCGEGEEHLVGLWLISRTVTSRRKQGGVDPLLDASHHGTVYRAAFF